MAALWIFICAWLNCAGWLLSAFQVLNTTGYTIALAVGVLIAWNFRHHLGLTVAPLSLRPHKYTRRFKRLFPLTFLLLASLAILGGILHPPANYDALAYRVPRILHWLAAEQWHWIHTDFPRMNTRICGIEWVSTPLILFLKTDRLLFLINAISFLLLPGLIFSLLRHLGVRPRVAWPWMWLLPGGYGYLLQAGSIANDMFGAVFALAAIDFALRARRTKKTSYTLLSILSAALLTSAKSSNLPLLLPWLIALLPSWRLLFSKPLTTALVVIFAAGASFLPTAALNIKNCGDWTGLNIESAIFRNDRPFFRLGVNAILLTTQNLVPPIFPLAAKWNALMQSSIPPGLAKDLQEQFEPNAARFGLGEMQMEEGAGLGCGLTLLLLLTAVGQFCYRNTTAGKGIRRLFCFEMLIVAASWVAVGVFMVKSGLSPASRYLIPHYFIIAAPLLLGSGVARIMQRWWWKAFALLGVAMAVALIVVTPPRPLWPAVTLLRSAGAENSTNPLVRRAWTVYSVYGERADSFAPARAILPPDANPLGFVTFDDPETSLWRPFGSRRIIHVTKTDTGADLRRQGIKYVLVSTTVLAVQYQTTIEEFLPQLDGEIVQTLPLALRAGTGIKDWHLVKIRDANPTPAR